MIEKEKKISFSLIVISSITLSIFFSFYDILKSNPSFQNELEKIIPFFIFTISFYTFSALIYGVIFYISLFTFLKTFHPLSIYNRVKSSDEYDLLCFSGILSFVFSFFFFLFSFILIYRAKDEEFLIKTEVSSSFFAGIIVLFFFLSLLFFAILFYFFNFFFKQIKITKLRKIPLSLSLLILILFVVLIFFTIIFIKISGNEDFRNIIRVPSFLVSFIFFHSGIFIIFSIFKTPLKFITKPKIAISLTVAVLLIFSTTIFSYPRFPQIRDIIERETIFLSKITRFYSFLLSFRENYIEKKIEPLKDEPPENKHEISISPAENKIIEKDEPLKNVIFIIIDTLREDCLNEEITPAISSFSKESVVFKNSYTQANNTPRAFPSILSSKYPSKIKWVKKFRNFSPLRDNETLLAEILKDNGIKTLAVLSHWYFDKKRNIHQGFEIWDNEGEGSIGAENTRITSPSILQRALSHLRKISEEKKNFFILIHFNDPHSRYMVHKDVPIFGNELRDKYDNEVMFVDMHFEKLLKEIKNLKIYENSLIIITSDHGEAFGEHRYYFHGHTLYEEEIRVPLIIKFRGIEHKVIEENVALIDIFPTILEYFGIKYSGEIDGETLYPIIKGEKRKNRIFAELLSYPKWNEDIFALIDGDMKIIFNKTRNLWELYNLRDDPREKRNLFYSEPEKNSRYRSLILQWIK